MNYIIDGYNLGFSDDQITSWIQRGDSDRAIQMIIQKIKSLIPQNSKAILVLDGKRGYFDSQYGASQIRVIFSKKPETADDIIRRIIRHESNPQLWSVISSDHEIQNTARDMGARVINSAEFLKSGGKKTKTDVYEKEPDMKFNPDREDLDYWLRQFKGDKDC